MQDRRFYSVKPHFVGINLGALVFIFSGTSQLSSGDASDSICPKGWGIAEYEGDGSYWKLIKNIYGENKNGVFTQSYQDYSKIRTDEILQQKSFSLIRNGYYYAYGGTREVRNTHGYYWEKTIINNNTAYELLFLENFIYLGNTDYRVYGDSVRCVDK